eukprot:TRINITY_DN1304_c0_g1_i1.p1 TRINITY_DN1304_c0_g1~~TRINITY_DN1304_c0_g1_i1.p1  ORF type:complete len:827 (-),score=135.82 TRINITY_DN1304_c0_g1_i1:998-3439(-)
MEFVEPSPPSPPPPTYQRWGDEAMVLDGDSFVAKRTMPKCLSLTLNGTYERNRSGLAKNLTRTVTTYKYQLDVEQCRTHCKENAAALKGISDPDSVLALDVYTAQSDAFKHVNEALRDPEHTDAKLEDWEDLVHCLAKGIEDLRDVDPYRVVAPTPAPETTTTVPVGRGEYWLHRGQWLANADLVKYFLPPFAPTDEPDGEQPPADEPDEQQQQKDVLFRSFTSTSKDETQAKSFLGIPPPPHIDQPVPVVFHIRPTERPAAVDIEKLSQYQMEREVLFQAFSSFVVDRVQQSQMQPHSALGSAPGYEVFLSELPRPQDGAALEVISKLTIKQLLEACLLIAVHSAQPLGEDAIPEGFTDRLANTLHLIVTLLQHNRLTLPLPEECPCPRQRFKQGLPVMAQIAELLDRNFASRCLSTAKQSAAICAKLVEIGVERGVWWAAVMLELGKFRLDRPGLDSLLKKTGGWGGRRIPGEEYTHCTDHTSVSRMDICKAGSVRALHDAEFRSRHVRAAYSSGKGCPKALKQLSSWGAWVRSAALPNDEYERLQLEALELVTCFAGLSQQLQRVRLINLVGHLNSGKTFFVKSSGVRPDLEVKQDVGTEFVTLYPLPQNQFPRSGHVFLVDTPGFGDADTELQMAAQESLDLFAKWATVRVLMVSANAVRTDTVKKQTDFSAFLQTEETPLFVVVTFMDTWFLECCWRPHLPDAAGGSVLRRRKVEAPAPTVDYQATIDKVEIDLPGRLAILRGQLAKYLPPNTLAQKGVQLRFVVQSKDNQGSLWWNYFIGNQLLDIRFSQEVLAELVCHCALAPPLY